MPNALFLEDAQELMAHIGSSGCHLGILVVKE